MKRRQRLCTCAECAELDLEFPGEGRQLAFPLKPQPRRKRAKRDQAANHRSAVQ